MANHEELLKPDSDESVETPVRTFFLASLCMKIVNSNLAGTEAKIGDALTWSLPSKMRMRRQDVQWTDTKRYATTAGVRQICCSAFLLPLPEWVSLFAFEQQKNKTWMLIDFMLSVLWHCEACIHAKSLLRTWNSWRVHFILVKKTKQSKTKRNRWLVSTPQKLSEEKVLSLPCLPSSERQKAVSCFQNRLSCEQTDQCFVNLSAIHEFFFAQFSITVFVDAAENFYCEVLRGLIHVLGRMIHSQDTLEQEKVVRKCKCVCLTIVAWRWDG